MCLTAIDLISQKSPFQIDFSDTADLAMQTDGIYWMTPRENTFASRMATGKSKDDFDFLKQISKSNQEQIEDSLWKCISAVGSILVKRTGVCTTSS